MKTALTGSFFAHPELSSTPTSFFLILPRFPDSQHHRSAYSEDGRRGSRYQVSSRATGLPRGLLTDEWLRWVYPRSGYIRCWLRIILMLQPDDPLNVDQCRKGVLSTDGRGTVELHDKLVIRCSVTFSQSVLVPPHNSFDCGTLPMPYISTL
jgi:hypothetical protein